MHPQPTWVPAFAGMTLRFSPAFPYKMNFDRSEFFARSPRRLVT